MTRLITEEGKDDLLGRGFSRRQMLRTAILVGGASALAGFSPEQAWAQDDDVKAEHTHAKIRIGQNECWTGPFAVGVAAGSAILSRSNRYAPDDQRGDFIRTVSQVENVPEDHVSPWPGSGEPLSRAVAVFCSPGKGLVTADPTYETPGRAAKFLEIPVKQVPLKADYSHDVRAMLAANPNAGVYYIVNPNNPSGTMTPMADIEWLVDNKPAGSIVLIDEAYIHWSDAYPNNTASHLAAAGNDVIILRTFSKIFGMAGARMGYFMARPDIVKKMQMYDGGTLSGQLPMPSLVCATTSLTAHDEIAKRRKELMTTRAITIDFLTKRNLKLIGPSQTNFVMIDWKTRTAKEMQAAFRAKDVEIAGGRWPIWPTVSRISIGSRQDMEGFFNAFNKVVSA
ncbi:MAG TPA: aminotransferase class I/II-fold pyridoxal phosphate-dependent enzyme [Rhizomicrobium sp.]|nr:aminotransferase class I/II-fold pyridoxal phosphate-dependent enzyme [Rhizomicrobium sp.]